PFADLDRQRDRATEVEIGGARPLALDLSDLARGFAERTRGRDDVEVDAPAVTLQRNQARGEAAPDLEAAPVADDGPGPDRARAPGAGDRPAAGALRPAKASSSAERRSREGGADRRSRTRASAQGCRS